MCSSDLVAELADDYDGSPEDGMEYLFMVRCIEPFSQRCSVGPGADSVHTDAKQRRTPGSTESAIPTRSWKLCRPHLPHR